MSLLSVPTRKHTIMLLKSQKKEAKAKINLMYLNHQSYQKLTLSKKDTVPVANNKMYQEIMEILLKFPY